MSRQVASDLLHVFVIEVEYLEIANFHSLRSHEDAVFWLALEKLLAINAAVVLTSRLVERDPNPRSQAGDGGNGTDEGDSAAAGISFGEETTARVDSDVFEIQKVSWDRLLEKQSWRRSIGGWPLL